MNLTFKVTKTNPPVIHKCQTHSKRRFLQQLRTINWENKPSKVYLRVYYGRYKDVWGKLSDFYNDGWYENEEDLLRAFNAFTEKD